MRPRGGDPMRPTAREIEVLRFVFQFIQQHGQAPTRAEIGAALGFCRPVAEQHLQGLRGAQMLKLRRQWRGISLTAKGVQHAQD